MRKTHGMWRTPEYNVWLHLKKRCSCKTNKAYRDYGGRGIRVCDSWVNSFESFLSDMGKRPSPEHSIDRIDVNGDYEPYNCRWATQGVQNNNKRNSRYIEHDGIKKTVGQWAKELNVGKDTLLYRSSHGWNETDIIKKPIKKSEGFFNEDVLIEMVQKGIKTGEMAKQLNRKYSSVAGKIFKMRKRGLLPPVAAKEHKK